MGTVVVRPRPAPDGTLHVPGQMQNYLDTVYQPNQDFAASFGAPIPGLTAPRGTGMGPAFGAQPSAPQSPVPGLMPPPGGGYSPPPFASAFQPAGQYGLLAQQLAGQRPQMPPGMGAPSMMPGQQYPLRQPPKGFRIPGGK